VSCIFGYAGQQQPGLIQSMAAQLGHRCLKGWYQQSISHSDGQQIFTLASAQSQWSQLKNYGDPLVDQVHQNQEKSLLCAHVGALWGDNTHSNQPVFNTHQPIDHQLMSIEGAFCLACVAEDKLYLLRDPSGTKVLYWALVEGTLVFASEVKAILAWKKQQWHLRASGVLEYLSLSYVPGQHTMFEGIYELQPGHLLSWNNKKVSVKRFFDFESFENQKIKANRSEYVDDLKKVLRRSVRDCCLHSQQAPGVFLSGGIDSSSVLAMLDEQYSNKKIHTYSIHFGANYANERSYIELMSEKYKTQHHWLEVSPKRFIQQLPEIIWKLDDPIGDPVTVPNYLMSQVASLNHDVVLNGEGGDPCFGGPKNIPMLLGKLYGPVNGVQSEDWLEHLYLHSYRRCYGDLEQLVNPDFYQQTSGKTGLIELIRPYLKAKTPVNFVNKLMAANIRLKGSNLIQVKVDKMSSAHGLLVLPPLFSKQIIETSMACPVGLKLEGNVEKYVLKEAVRGMVPSEIIDRPKSGMMVPVRFWFQGEMKRYAKKLLSKKNLEQVGLFNPNYVKELLKYETGNISGRRHGLKLWMLMTFMLWHEQMVGPAYVSEI